MTRVIIKFNNGEFLNIRGDCFDVRDGIIMAWEGEYLVAYVKAELVDACYMSEKKE